MTNNPRNLVLSIQIGPWKGRSYSIPPGKTFTIGRREPATIEIDVDDCMSGVHFEVDNQNETAWIRDLGSRNKTYVNQKIITSAELNEGDEIRAGKTVFQTIWESAPHASLSVPESRRETHPHRDTDPTPAPARLPSEQPQLTSELPQQPYEPQRSSPLPSFMEEEAPAFVEETNDKDMSTFDLEYMYVEDTAPPSRIAVQENVDKGDSDFDFSAFDNYSPEDSSRSIEVASSVKPRETRERSSDRAGIQSLSLYQSPVSSFALLLESLVDVAEFMVVPHFRKLGVDIPVGLEEISLFPDLPGASRYLPVGVMGNTWVQGFNQKWTQRLVQNDGIVVLLGQDCVGLTTRLSRGAVDGFSLSNGFLGWYWPTQLLHMRRRMSKESLLEWIGENSMALVYPDVDQSIVSSIANGRAVNILEGLGFELQ